MNNHNKVSFAVSSFLSNGAPLRARGHSDPLLLFVTFIKELRFSVD